MKKSTVFSCMHLLILLLIFNFSAYSQQIPDDSIQTLYKLSVKVYQAEDFSEFFHLTKKIVDMAPLEYKYQYNLACAYALNGDTQNAVKTLQFLLDENSDFALLAENDLNFTALHNNPGFKKILTQIKKKTQPVNNSHIAFSVPEKDLIPEGIAYDPVDKAFFLGSLQKCKIIRIDKNGNISNFTQPRQDGLVSVLGMKVDAKRRTLWVVSSYGFFNSNIPRELLGTSGVFKYDLNTRKLLKKYMLPQGEKHFLNDLTIASNGDVYVTDWMVYAVYKISAKRDTIEKFCDLPRRPNGIDFSDKKTKIFIAGSGIGVLDINTKNFCELIHPRNMLLSGDGLYFYKNSLIAVQNKKVTRFYLNKSQDTIIDAQVLEAYNPLFNIPTTGAVAGNWFYFIANSQLQNYDNKGNLFPLNELEKTVILKVKLK